MDKRASEVGGTLSAQEIKRRVVSQVHNGIRKRVAIDCLRLILFFIQCYEHHVLCLRNDQSFSCDELKIASMLAPPIFVFLDYRNDERLRYLACLLGLLNSIIEFVNVMLVSVVSGVRAWLIRFQTCLPCSDFSPSHELKRLLGKVCLTFLIGKSNVKR